MHPDAPRCSEVSCDVVLFLFHEALLLEYFISNQFLKWAHFSTSHDGYLLAKKLWPFAMTTAQLHADFAFSFMFSCWFPVFILLSFSSNGYQLWLIIPSSIWLFALTVAHLVVKLMLLKYEPHLGTSTCNYIVILLLLLLFTLGSKDP